MDCLFYAPHRELVLTDMLGLHVSRQNFYMDRAVASYTRGTEFENKENETWGIFHKTLVIN